MNEHSVTILFDKLEQENIQWYLHVCTSNFVYHKKCNMIYISILTSFRAFILPLNDDIFNNLSIIFSRNASTSSRPGTRLDKYLSDWSM